MNICPRHMRIYRGSTPVPPSERFWLKVDKNGPVPAYRPDFQPCWLWLAAITRGYGRFGVRAGKMVPAHVFSYEAIVAPVPKGLVLDHLCRVRHCVNPAHLEPVTRGENVRRGIGVGEGGAARQRVKTHCPLGHAYDIYKECTDGYLRRRCRRCNQRTARQRQWRRALKLQLKGMG